jgi:multimeric flavodoxin WrbA
MEKTSVIILGSSRSNGNTRIIVDEMRRTNPSIDLIDLNDYNISYYDYKFNNSDDDFLELFKTILNYNTLIFATPIYWYTMSAQMKTFFDRISDVLKGDEKMYGRQLKGKRLAVISCGSDQEISDGFIMPFEQSANYLNMEYVGHLHTWLEPNRKFSKLLKVKLEHFIKEIT